MSGQAAGEISLPPNGSQKDDEFEIGIPTDRLILYESVVMILTVIVLYIVIALLRYNWLRERNLRPTASTSRKIEGSKVWATNHSLTSDSTTSHISTTTGRSKKDSSKDSKILRIGCSIASIFTLSRILTEQVELLSPKSNRANCRHYQIANVLTYAFGAMMLYCILWFRVRIFIMHPAMKHLGAKFLYPTTYVVLFLILVAGVVIPIVFLATGYSVEGDGGCRIQKMEGVLSDNAFIILAVFTLVFQLSLLGLFLFPLIRHSIAMKDMSPSTPKKTPEDKETRPSSTSSAPSASKNEDKLKRQASKRRKKREQALFWIIRRVMITASICCVSDMFSAFIIRTVESEPRIVTNLIYDVNIVVNLICVLVSFQDWRVRIFPDCIRRNRKKSEDGIKRKKRRSAKGVKQGYDLSPSSPRVFHSVDFFSANGGKSADHDDMDSGNNLNSTENSDKVTE